MTGSPKDHLKTVPLKPLDDETHEAFMKIVEQWIENRRQGKARVVAIAIAAVHADGSVGTMYESCEDYYALLGALTSLQHRMERDGDD